MFVVFLVETFPSLHNRYYPNYDRVNRCLLISVVRETCVCCTRIFVSCPCTPFQQRFDFEPAAPSKPRRAQHLLSPVSPVKAVNTTHTRHPPPSPRSSKHRLNHERSRDGSAGEHQERNRARGAAWKHLSRKGGSRHHPHHARSQVRMRGLRGCSPLAAGLVDCLSVCSWRWRLDCSRARKVDPTALACFRGVLCWTVQYF